MSEQKTVPVEPTEAMVSAGKYVLKGGVDSEEWRQAVSVYKSMLAAAPSAEPVAQQSHLTRMVSINGIEYSAQNEVADEIDRLREMTQPTEQSGSKTPRTDAAEDFKTGPYDKVVPVEFARELETALPAAEARAEAETSRADNAERELAAARVDVERLDWLGSRRDGFANIDRITSVHGRFNGVKSLRAAIDAAIKEKK